MASYQMIYNEV